MSRTGTIDGLRFAAARETVKGVLGIGDLPRLAELGCSAADVHYAVRGDADGEPALTIEAHGEIELTCQRCLERFGFPVAVASVLALAASPAEIDAAQDERDRVLASPAMDLAALIEDELILAAPMIPMHARCETGGARGTGLTETSPFAALAGLKQIDANS